jgi:hypothetical protein
MILARYSIEVLPGHEEFGRAGSSQANVFVDCDDQEQARVRAEAYLRQEKCRIMKFERVDRLRGDVDKHADSHTQAWMAAARQHGVFGWFLYTPIEADNPNPLS